jgi:hypothetical protein
MTEMIDRNGSTTTQTTTESSEESARRLRRARQFVRVSAFLLFVSLFAVIACTRLEWSRVVPYLLWNHVAIMAVAIYGTFSVRSLSKRPPGRASPRPGDLFARPILLLAVVAAMVAIPNWGPSPWNMGQAPDGSVATHHSWHESPDGSRYFESFNRGPDLEITEAQYDELNRGLYSMFARMWVLFSFIALMMWRFVALSRQDAAAEPDSLAKTPVATVSGAESPRWKSTAVIATIWTLAIGANLIDFAQGSRQQLCSTPMPPATRLFVLVMPLVFFGVAALFMKRSPFISPWIASLIDEKLGAGSSAAFMTRLKPLLLFSAAGLIGSAAMAKDCWQGGEGQVDLTMPGFLLSGSLAFALVHLILRLRRVPGV